MDDIRKLLGARCEPETVALHLAQAKCRLFPILIGQPFIESTASAETDESKIHRTAPLTLSRSRFWRERHHSMKVTSQ
jgi:hypothetical protein